MQKLRAALVSFLLALSLAACSGHMQIGQSPHAQREVQIEYGKLLAAQVTRVPDKNASAAAGAVGGALIGGALGNAIMHGKARKNGMLVGAGLGALSGASGAAAMSNYKTVEYTVAKDTGGNVLISQQVPVNEAPLIPGRRVMIQTSGGESRVALAVE